MSRAQQKTATAASAETSIPEAAPKSNLEKFADIFREETPQASPEKADDEAPGAEKPGKKPGKPKALKDVAERLELAPEDLYGLEIPMGDHAEPLTLGKLKDIAAGQSDFTVRELKAEEERTRKESDLIRAQEEIRELVESVPQQFRTPELLNKIREKHDARLKIERARTLDAIPEWNDEPTRDREIAGMVEHLQAFGFPANYLLNVVDHRLMKFVRESFLREQRIRRALEQVTGERPSTPAKARGSSTPPAKLADTRRARGSDTPRTRLFDALNLTPE